MSKSSIIKTYKMICLTALPLVMCSMLSAQNVDTSAVVRTMDYTGKNPWAVMKMCIDESLNDVIVVLIRGGDQALNDKVEGELQALVHAGYNRIGLVYADLLPSENESIISIMSDGTLYAAIPHAKTTNRTEWEVYNLVKDAYNKHITPKLKPGG